MPTPRPRISSVARVKFAIDEPSSWVRTMAPMSSSRAPSGRERPPLPSEPDERESSREFAHSEISSMTSFTAERFAVMPKLSE